jgi:hypothetical protein
MARRSLSSAHRASIAAGLRRYWASHHRGGTSTQHNRSGGPSLNRLSGIIQQSPTPGRPGVSGRQGRQRRHTRTRVSQAASSVRNSARTRGAVVQTKAKKAKRKAHRTAVGVQEIARYSKAGRVTVAVAKHDPVVRAVQRRRTRRRAPARRRRR